MNKNQTENTNTSLLMLERYSLIKECIHKSHIQTEKDSTEL